MKSLNTTKFVIIQCLIQNKKGEISLSMDLLKDESAINN